MKSAAWHLHRTWAGIVDGVTFSLVNMFHRRHFQAASSPEEVRAYLDEWPTERRADFFSPKEIDMDEWPIVGADEHRIVFETPFPDIFPENNRAVFDFFPCAGTWERPIMFLLHGLMSVSDRGYRQWAKRINEQGWHAVFVHLPYHYGRCPSGYLSGELAVGPHLRTVQGVRQAVVEVRSLIRWLHKKGVPYVGCWGMSYGGWVAALLAVCEPAVRCALLLEPIVDFEHAVWDSPASSALRGQLEKSGFTRDLIRELDGLVSPMLRKPCCDKEMVAVLAAEFDKVIPLQVAQSFAEKWGCPRFRCYRQGHVGYRLMREAFREWSQELAPMIRDGK